MYTPFNIEVLSNEELVNKVQTLVDACTNDDEDMVSLSEDVIIMTDILYIYGELYSRAQKEYALLKYQNNTEETLLAYKLKSESKEKFPIAYFNSLAQQEMLEKRKEELEAQLNSNRLKYAYDATQENINAIKKKIDTMKYSF